MQHLGYEKRRAAQHCAKDPRARPQAQSNRRMVVVIRCAARRTVLLWPWRHGPRKNFPLPSPFYHLGLAVLASGAVASPWRKFKVRLERHCCHE